MSNEVEKPPKPLPAVRRIEAAYTQCYVVGGLIASIGGAIGFASESYNWCVVLILLGCIIVATGVVLHRKVTSGLEIFDSLGLDDPMPKPKPRVVNVFSLPAMPPMHVGVPPIGGPGKIIELGNEVPPMFKQAADMDAMLMVTGFQPSEPITYLNPRVEGDMRVFNVGDAPAAIQAIVYRVSWRAPDMVMTEKWPIQHSPGPFRLIIPPKKGWEQHVKIDLLPPVATAVEKGVAVLYLVGLASYRDSAGFPRDIHFRCQYIPGAGKFVNHPDGPALKVENGAIVPFT
jgi:hypothetical protein